MIGVMHYEYRHEIIARIVLHLTVLLDPHRHLLPIDNHLCLRAQASYALTQDSVGMCAKRVSSTWFIPPLPINSPCHAQVLGWHPWAVWIYACCSLGLHIVFTINDIAIGGLFDVKMGGRVQKIKTTGIKLA